MTNKYRCRSDVLTIVHLTDSFLRSAYELYADLHGQEDESAAAHFKKTFSAKGAHVHFVGVWCVYELPKMDSILSMSNTGTLSHLSGSCAVQAYLSRIPVIMSAIFATH